jgi:predicted anti-sigma-YlaC factor YlaD
MEPTGTDCQSIRTEISAGLDGEAPFLGARAVALHLSWCAACREFERNAAALHRSTRLTPAPAVPDLGPRILGAIGERERESSPRSALRVGLAIVALVQIGLAIPALVLGDDAGLPAHTARHLGSFAVALGVGFLFAAWRPARIAGLFPVAAVLVACLVATSLIDVASGRASSADELTHVTELVGLAALWLLSRTEVTWRLADGAAA